MSNPWQRETTNTGPIFGNAYESNLQTHSRMEPSGYSNAWSQESNKVLQEEPRIYEGEPYGQHPPSTFRVPQNVPAPPVQESYFETKNPNKPSQWNFLLTFIIFISSIGHLGFAAGARPYSGEKVPFDTSACFYYLFAVAALSILWSGYHLLFSCWRYISKTEKMKRSIMFSIDLVMVILWGIGIIIEIAKFRCTWGGKFCAFYNVSIFWGFLTFVSYIVSLFWDLLGGCCQKR